MDVSWHFIKCQYDHLFNSQNASYNNSVDDYNACPLGVTNYKSNLFEGLNEVVALTPLTAFFLVLQF